MDKKDVKKDIKERLKVVHGIKGNEQDKYIDHLTSNAFDEFKLLTSSDTVDEGYLFVIEGVVNKRYIRRRNDGVLSQKSSNVWITYKEDEGDYAEYMSLLSIKYGVEGTEELVVFL